MMRTLYVFFSETLPVNYSGSGGITGGQFDVDDSDKSAIRAAMLQAFQTADRSKLNTKTVNFWVTDYDHKKAFDSGEFANPDFKLQ